MIEKLNRKNAKAFYIDYMKSKEAALSALVSEAKIEGVILNFTPDSLTPAWRWAYPKYSYIEYHPNLNEMPLWYLAEYVNEVHFSGPPLTILAAQVHDRIAYYFGEVLIRNLKDLDWNCCMEKGSTYDNRPIITGATALYPLRTVRNLLARAAQGNSRFSDDALKETFDYISEEILSGNGHSPIKSCL